MSERCKCGHSTLDHWPGDRCLVPGCDCKKCEGDPQPVRLGGEVL